ncbi:MAG: hypothetical protein GXY82_10905 [Methanospirillum sp.]|nr:hypothetical protein [Methanospirillum sp.]
MACFSMRATLLALGLILALVAPCWAATSVGVSTGTFVVHCPVEGASVWFDKDYKGQIANGVLVVPVFITATPYQTFRVEADGFDPFLGMIVEYPPSGGTVHLQAILTPSPVGGGTGTIQFTANVDGASVFLDGDYRGEIQNGQLLVTVYSTGTPYRNYTLLAPDFRPAVGPVPRMPLAGENIEIAVNLTPREAPTAIGGDRGVFLVLCPVDGAEVWFDDDHKGVIENGELAVPVYVTGTPYKTIRVNATGMSPYSAPIMQYPARDQVVTLNVVLEPVPATTEPVVIGGDIGYFLVRSNAEGGQVSFDGDVKGNITDGVLNVSVYVTGTPYRTWSVSKDGFAPFNGTIIVYPAKGETIDLQAVLSVLTMSGTPAANATATGLETTTTHAANETTAAPTTTQSPLSLLPAAGAFLVLTGLGLAGRRR